MTLRDHILETSRDLFEAKENSVRLALAWASMDKQLLEAREQRDMLLEALRALLRVLVPEVHGAEELSTVQQARAAIEKVGK